MLTIADKRGEGVVVVNVISKYTNVATVISDPFGALVTQVFTILDLI